MNEKQKVEQNPDIESITDVRLQPKDKWHDMYHSAFEEAQASGTPLVVVIADNNFLKEVNDNLGHSEGDRAIKASKDIAAVSIATIRTLNNDPDNNLDLVLSESPTRLRHNSDAEAGSLGGDEVVAYFTGTDEEAKKYCQAYRDTYKKLLEKPEYKDLAKLGVSIAVGYAILEDGMTEKELITKADMNMYENKSDQMPGYSVAQKLGIKVLKLDAQEQGINISDIDRYDRKEALDMRRMQPELPFDDFTERTA